MAVFQPLYFSGGKYSAGVDRMLLAALIGPETDGSRQSGVVPAGFGTNSLKVENPSGTGRVLTIRPGLCVIQDSTSPSVEAPGAYLCGVDSSNETVAIEANAGGSNRIDSIFAVVDETAYQIINKKLDANIATITTSTAHGFRAGQTVTISGVDSIFDGSHVILADPAPTSTAFSYTGVGSLSSGALLDVRAEAYVGDATNGIKSAVLTNKALASNEATLTTSAAHGFTAGQIVTVKGVDGTFDGTYEITQAPTVTTFTYGKISADISSGVISNSYSSSAVARVPFAIKVEKSGGTTLDGKTKLRLATVSVPGGNAGSIPAINVTDTRQYMSVVGGMQYYSSTSVASGLYPTGGVGKSRFDVATNSYQIYDNITPAWRSVLHSNGASGSVTISATGPTGGSSGDIWIQI
jgi:DNA/RNA endonuclease YhcR with UshA esterase domain